MKLLIAKNRDFELKNGSGFGLQGFNQILVSGSASNYLYLTGQNRSFHIFYPIIHLTLLTQNSLLPTLYQPFLLLFGVRGQLAQST